MSRFQISKEEYEAVKAAEKAVKDKKTSRRLRILMLRYEGYKVADIAKKNASARYAESIGNKGWKNSYGTSIKPIIGR